MKARAQRSYMIEQGMRLLSMKSIASKSKSSARVERKSSVRRTDQTYSALYYPFIHFKDDWWLKLSALFWDRIGRVVPTGYITQDSPTVTGLNSIVTTLAPSLADPAFGKPFIEFIHEYAPTLQQKYAVVKRDTWKCLPKEIRPPINGGPSGDDRRLLYIYYEKIPPDLYEALQKSGLALIDYRGSPWIGMHPDLAWVYMTALAEHIAKETGLRTLTDETRDFVAVSDLSIERLAQILLDETPTLGSKPTATEREDILVSVAFQTIIPKNLGSLSTEKILEFREKYPKDRAKFQTTAATFFDDRKWLSEISSRRVLEERLQDQYAKTWAAEVTELRDKLNSVGIDTMYSCFSSKALLGGAGATGLSSIGLGSDPLIAGAAGAAGLAVGAMSVIRGKRKKAARLLEESPVAYLYRMEQDLKPADLWSWIKQRAMRLTLNV
jgi:hypothetical protein